MEAALYAVPLSHVRVLAETGSKSGIILLRFKNDMGTPIAAILILNTIANTGGASIAGWAGAALFSEGVLILFSCCFVLAILYLSEIVPKIIGVSYSKVVATAVATPLYYLIKLLGPLVAFSRVISRKIEGVDDEPSVSHEELLSLTALGTEEGAIDHFEGSVISNVIGLDQVCVRDILTPRVVVFRLPAATPIGELKDDIAEWSFSRVPIYSEDDPDHLSGYVNQRDIFRALLRGEDSKALEDLSRPLKAVPELIRADKLLLQFFEDKDHICTVVDEHGGLAGIITLEDIIEEIVGQEIVDEYDAVSDMRTLARIMRVIRGRKR